MRCPVDELVEVPVLEELLELVAVPVVELVAVLVTDLVEVDVRERLGVAVAVELLEIEGLRVAQTTPGTATAVGTRRFTVVQSPTPPTAVTVIAPTVQCSTG